MGRCGLRFFLFQQAIDKLHLEVPPTLQVVWGRQLARIQWFMLGKGTSQSRIRLLSAQNHWSIVIRSRVLLPFEKLLMEVPPDSCFCIYLSCLYGLNDVMTPQTEKKQGESSYCNSSPSESSQWDCFTKRSPWSLITTDQDTESLPSSCQLWWHFVWILLIRTTE